MSEGVGATGGQFSRFTFLIATVLFLSLANKGSRACMASDTPTSFSAFSVFCEALWEGER